jgi:hypothetical protein
LAVPQRAYAQAEEAPLSAVDPAPTVGPASSTPAPATAPAAATNAPPPEIRGHGLVFIPNLGLNLPVGTLDRSYSAGLRVGALVGWHLSPRVSINGELTLDLMDADKDSSFVAAHEYYLDFALSPLFHFRSGAIVVGPQLGWFVNSRSQDAGTGREALFTGGSRSGSGLFGPDAATVAVHTGQGLVLGINAGGFVPTRKVAIGLLAGFTFRRFAIAECSGSDCAGDLGNTMVASVALAATH